MQGEGVGSRPRGESVIMTDMEYIRPRYTLVFSMTAIFLLIALNVSFWFQYLSVIIWAIAASQLIRPLTEDCVRFVQKLQKRRVKEKGNILRLLFQEMVKNSEKIGPNVGNGTDALAPPVGDLLDLPKRTIRKSQTRLEVVAVFIFSNSTMFLIAAIFFHLMPIQYFIETVVIIALFLVCLSLIMDYTGVTDALLRSLARPEIVSSMIIFGMAFSLIFVGGTLITAALFEMADMASEFSNSISFFVSQMSQTEFVDKLSADLVWIQDSANNIYEYSNKEFGSRKWWIVVEALRTSFERGDAAEVMAKSGMEQMRIAYNNTDWLDLVEVAVMAAVPGHRKQMPVEEFSVTKLLSTASLASVWPRLVETVWRFSSLGRDVLRYFSDFAGQFVVFFYILQRLCKSPRDVITSVCLFTVPATSKAKKRLNDDLQNALKNAFTDPAVSAVKSALVVLLVYGVLNLPGAFISASFVSIVSSLHIFPEYLGFLACSLPWILYQLLRFYIPARENSPSSASFSFLYIWIDTIRALLLPVLLVRVNALANYSRRATANQRAVSPWLTDFSLAVGVSQFKADGIILGPFLAAVSYVVANFALEVAEQDMWWDDMAITEAARVTLAKRGSEVKLASDQTTNHRQQQQRRAVSSSHQTEDDEDDGMGECSYSREIMSLTPEKRPMNGLEHRPSSPLSSGTDTKSTEIGTKRTQQQQQPHTTSGPLSPNSSLSETRKSATRRTIKI